MHWTLQPITEEKEPPELTSEIVAIQKNLELLDKSIAINYEILEEIQKLAEIKHPTPYDIENIKSYILEIDLSLHDLTKTLEQVTDEYALCCDNLEQYPDELPGFKSKQKVINIMLKSIACNIVDLKTTLNKFLQRNLELTQLLIQLHKSETNLDQTEESTTASYNTQKLGLN